jgi:hypothetical protein
VIADRVSYRHGDFLQLAASVSPADIVILERVLNVSREWEHLAALAAERTRRRLGVVIPRNTLVVRAVIGVINLSLRRRGKHVRAAVMPLAALDRIAATLGLSRRSLDNAGPALAGRGLRPGRLSGWSSRPRSDQREPERLHGSVRGRLTPVEEALEAIEHDVQREFELCLVVAAGADDSLIVVAHLHRDL